jgi:hypothetical protein
MSETFFFANADTGVVLSAVEEIGQRPATTLRRELGKFDDCVGYPWRFDILSPFGLQFGGRLRFLEVFLERRVCNDSASCSF